jgi:hypothetical protein
MNNIFDSSCRSGPSGPSTYFKGYKVVYNLNNCIICGSPFYEDFEVYVSATYGTISGVHNNKECIEISEASKALGKLKKNNLKTNN